MIPACKEEYSNPEFAPDEIYIYYYGSGERPNWKEYNVTVGESLTIHLQVSPKDATYKWVLNDTEVGSELQYTYEAVEERSDRLYFIATRNQYSDTAVFKINANLPGETSLLNQWQSFEIENQTGEFIAEFDMVASMDSIDAVTGFLKGISTGFGDLSCIVRFTKDGRLDARNGGSYEYDADIPYSAGQNMHVRMEINVGTNTYDVYVTPEGGSEIQLADDYGFRRSNIALDHWAIIYGDWQPVNVGSHRISNMTITTISQNEAPIIAPIPNYTVTGGGVLEVEVQATDPLGEGIAFEVEGLPRFATFNDNGDGTGTFVFKPYGDCGGCDDGDYNIILSAVNRLHTTTDTFMVSVASIYQIIASINDAHIYDKPRLVDPNQVELVAGKMDPTWLPDYEGVSSLCMVLPFEVPEIPAGMKIINAELKLQVTASTSWDSNTNYDLYGISARDADSVLPSDFFTGVYDTDTNADVTALQAAMINGAEPVGEHTYGATGLEAFINDQIQNGATGKYVFLRINPDRLDQPTWSTLKIQSANGDNNNPDYVKPTLVLYLGQADN